MQLKFISDTHSYVSVDTETPITWQSVTSVVSNYKKHFDADAIAIKSSKNKKSKWYGLTPEEIKEAWKEESKRAVNLGTWYHNQRESDILECSFLNLHGCDLPVIKPIIQEDGVKIAPSQKLEPGIYPEHFVYLKSAGICGQSDRVEVANGLIYVNDYKTNKEIKIEPYTSWDGIKEMMLGPVAHIPDCNYWHYALQLSFYMYIMLKHNPRLQPGTLTIDHIIFEEAGKNKYGNPIHITDALGNPIIKDIVKYELPFLKKEVIAIINDLNEKKC